MRKRIVSICLMFLLVLALLGVFGLYSSKYFLSESSYTVSSSKIVQLTDLHNSEFGENNSKLVDRVAAQQPDLILVTGDLLNQDTERTDIAATLISGLKEIAPVYVSYGNHEVGHEKKYGSNLRALYTEAGATVLEYDWTGLTVKGQQIRLGGLYGYCLPGKYLKTGEARKNECAFLEEFQDTTDMTILMCHMPVCWIINGSLNDWNVDMVFAGHSHGGQVVFLNGNGLWAPDLGWFPGRVQGLFHSQDGEKTLVLSRGLGNRDTLPSFNNIPEILIADIVPASE